MKLGRNLAALGSFNQSLAVVNPNLAGGQGGLNHSLAVVIWETGPDSPIEALRSLASGSELGNWLVHSRKFLI